jgi:hypothetical protein
MAFRGTRSMEVEFDAICTYQPTSQPSKSDGEFTYQTPAPWLDGTVRAIPPEGSPTSV